MSYPPSTTHCCSLKEREALCEDEEEWEEASDFEDIVQNARVQEGSNGLVISLGDAKGARPLSCLHEILAAAGLSLLCMHLMSTIAQNQCIRSEHQQGRQFSLHKSTIVQDQCIRSENQQGRQYSMYKTAKTNLPVD